MIVTIEVASQHYALETNLTDCLGDDKLILMTSTFDILSEAPIHATEFGQEGLHAYHALIHVANNYVDAPINVGWGSKQTQFHGSLGKSAAQALIGASPDDDAAPRISWRGDGAFYTVSTLLPTVRIYDREGALQSTAEAIAGLEHPLVHLETLLRVRNALADLKVRGPEGKHDVVFFERNGLRHGEFRIRAIDLAGKGKGKEVGKWRYRVQELSWSSDSNVLVIWVHRDEGDVVQFWTIGNYHWYLKQEIEAPALQDEPRQFTSVVWYPEQALHIILTMRTTVIQRTYG
ncbi:hypothetical protein H0H92_002707 [Tricholoma furcatifolium]|nr:hypothetical protein H0H92_002707 [Tricholoma furcatifolium]